MSIDRERFTQTQEHLFMSIHHDDNLSLIYDTNGVYISQTHTEIILSLLSKVTMNQN